MVTNFRRSLLLAGAMTALAGVMSVPAAAADTKGTAAPYEASAPLVVAQASTPGMAGDRVVVPARAYPEYQRGVREAASQGPEALRRYIWRTRMIYNFYYPDFVLD